jgi:hypothetical protein
MVDRGLEPADEPVAVQAEIAAVGAQEADRVRAAGDRGQLAGLERGEVAGPDAQELGDIAELLAPGLPGLAQQSTDLPQRSRRSGPEPRRRAENVV